MACAAPLGGSVVAGSAAIDQASGVTTITQTTDRAIVNWQGFSTAAGEAVRFAQPGAASVTLNRVTGAGHSQLDGTMTANGRVFVLNPNGVVFGATSQVNAAGLVASSLSMSDSDFMAGRYRLAQEDARAGAVVNKGRIETTHGGRVALVAPAVANEGTISAPGGSVALAAGARATVNLDCGLVDLDVDAGTVRRDVQAPEGASEALSTAVNNRNLVAAGSAALEDGVVVLGAAEGVAVNTGTLAAERVDMNSTQLTLIAGQGEARGADVRVLGQDRVALVDAARVDASGATGGGRALVGGGREGSGVPAAKITLVARGVQIHADALCEGDGGEIVVRGGESARVRGVLSVRGGAAGGDGGFVETSAPRLDVKARVDIGAPAGRGGEWLIDPQNITVVAGCGLSNATQCGGGACVTFNTTGCCATIGVDCIVAALAGACCATVTVQTGAAGGGAGDINISTAIDYDGIGTGDTLNFSAHGSIVVNGAILDGAPGGDTLQVNLTADSDTNCTGGITVNAPITASGVSLVAGQDISLGALVDAGASATINGANILDAGGGTPVLSATAVNFGGGAGGVFRSGNCTLPFNMSAQNIIAVKCGVVRLDNTRSGSVTICGLVGGAFDLIHNAPPGGGITVGCCGISSSGTLTLVATGANQTILARNVSGTAVSLITGPCGTIAHGGGRITGSSSVCLAAGIIGCGAPVLTDTPTLVINAARAGGPIVQVNDLQVPTTLSVTANLNNANTFAIREDCGAPSDLLVLCGANLSGTSSGAVSLVANEPLVPFTLNGLTAGTLSVSTMGDLSIGPGGGTATGLGATLTSVNGNVVLCGNFDATTPGATITINASGGFIGGPGAISQCGGNVVLTARCSIGCGGGGQLIAGGANASLSASSGLGGTGGVFLRASNTLTVNTVNAQGGAGDVELTVLCGGINAPVGAGPFITGNRVTLSSTSFIGSCDGSRPMNMQASTLVATLCGAGQFVNTGSLCVESVVNCAPASLMSICATGTLSLKTVVGAAVFLGSAVAIVDADGDTDVTACTVTMNAPGGIGAANAIDLDVPSVQVSGLCSASTVRIESTNAAGFADVTVGSTTGNVEVTATACAASQIGVNNISGAVVTLIATGNIVDADIGPDDNDITATSLAATGGGFGAPCGALRIETAVPQLAINVTAGQIAFDNTGATTLCVTGGTVSGTTSGGLALASISAIGAVDLTAGGAITDANGAAVNITGATVTLSGTAAGSVADPLETNVNDLTVNAGSGDIAVVDSGALTFEGHTTGNLALGAVGAIVLRASDAGIATVETDNADITGALNASQMTLNALPVLPCVTPTSTINVCIGGGGVIAQAGALTRVAATGTVSFVLVTGGAVDLSSASDVTVGSVTAASSAIVVSGGDILDGGGTIVSPILSLFANSCVGIAGDAIEIAAGSLSTHAVTGSVFVADLDALDVSSAIAAASIDIKANGDLGVGAITACTTVRLESVSGNVLATDPCAFIDATSASIFAAGIAGSTATPIEVCLTGRLAVTARGQAGGISGAFEGTVSGSRILALGPVPGQLLLNGVSAAQRIGSIVRLAQVDPALAVELFGANGQLAVQAIQNQDKALARQLFRTAPLVFSAVATPAGGPAALGTLPLGHGLIGQPPPAADTSAAPDPIITPDDDESF